MWSSMCNLNWGCTACHSMCSFIFSDVVGYNFFV